MHDGNIISFLLPHCNNTFQGHTVFLGSVYLWNYSLIDRNSLLLMNELFSQAFSGECCDACGISGEFEYA